MIRILGGTNGDANKTRFNAVWGNLVPNITSDIETGIREWHHREILDVLQIGMLLDGDFTGGAMAEVTRNMTELGPGDLSAIAFDIKTVLIIRNNLTKT